MGWVPPGLPPPRPSPARDVPRIDADTADVERLAHFLLHHDPQFIKEPLWSKPGAELQEIYRDRARALVRHFDELEEILAEILDKGGQF